MKSRFLYFLSTIIILSCSKSEGEKFSINNFPQSWELIGISTGISGHYLSGKKLLWNEQILLKADSTFIKTRQTSDATVISKGIYVIDKDENMPVLILTHHEENSLITNCSNSLDEWYGIHSNKLMNGGADPCDGLGLYFERTD